MDKTKQFVSWSLEYDLFYAKADYLFKKYNPCKFDNKTGLCEGVRTNAIWFQEWWTPFVLCCNACTIDRRRSKNHSKEKGCRIRALGCKLFYCHRQSLGVPDEFMVQLALLRDEVYESKTIPSCWDDKGHQKPYNLFSTIKRLEDKN